MMQRFGCQVRLLQQGEHIFPAEKSEVWKSEKRMKQAGGQEIGGSNPLVPAKK